MSKNVVYCGSTDGIMYAVDLQTGMETWRYNIGDPIYSSPAISELGLFVGSETGWVYRFE